MFKFKKKDSEFFDLFVESANYFYKGALMMDEVMLDYSMRLIRSTTRSSTNST